jgi:hypothetical protein
MRHSGSKPAGLADHPDVEVDGYEIDSERWVADEPMTQHWPWKS